MISTLGAGSALDTARRAYALSLYLDPRVQIDPDLAREAGMDGNGARFLMAARLLDQPERLEAFLRPETHAERLLAVLRG